MYLNQPFLCLDFYYLFLLIYLSELNLTDKCLDGVLNNNNYESEILQVSWDIPGVNTDVCQMHVCFSQFKLFRCVCANQTSLPCTKLFALQYGNSMNQRNIKFL